MDRLMNAIAAADPVIVLAGAVALLLAGAALTLALRSGSSRRSAALEREAFRAQRARRIAPIVTGVNIGTFGIFFST